MIVIQDLGFDKVLVELRRAFLQKGVPVNVGEWQAIKDPNLPMSKTIELQNVSVQVKIPDATTILQRMTKPNLPWAEDHFSERVSGEPLNPPPSHQWWPYAQASNEKHMRGEKFSHTYPERFWPRWAGEHFEGIQDSMSVAWEPNQGIRYPYGDLQDVVNQLDKSIGTRQAYLPVWFPEDTGAVHGERVPCTLGYHFLVRHERLSLTYYIRSCDLLRHFQDDVYMAARLAQWMVTQLQNRGYNDLRCGFLVMHMASLHIFQGEEERLKREIDEAQQG